MFVVIKPRLQTDPIALLNVIEVILNVEYLYLRHTSPRSERQKSKSGVLRYHGHAPLVGFASALMTLSKTALYWLQGKSLN
jgi:uroporphyrin-III C-methyltransferase